MTQSEYTVQNWQNVKTSCNSIVLPLSRLIEGTLLPNSFHFQLFNIREQETMPQNALIQQSMKTWPNMMQTSLFFSLYTNINLAFVLNFECILLWYINCAFIIFAKRQTFYYGLNFITNYSDLFCDYNRGAFKHNSLHFKQLH